MAGTFPWNSLTANNNLITTGLNSLADATLSAASTAISNQTAKDTHAIAEIYLASLTPVTPGYIELYMVKAPDGTNYEDAPVIGGLDVNTWIQNIPVQATTAAHRVTSLPFLIPPFPIKFYIGNQLNVAMASSGNILNVYTGILAYT